MNKRFIKREANSRNVYFKRFIMNKGPNKIVEYESRQAVLKNSLKNKSLVKGMQGLMAASEALSWRKDFDYGFIEAAIEKWSKPGFKPEHSA